MEKMGQGHSGKSRDRWSRVDSARRKQVRQGPLTQPFHSANSHTKNNLLDQKQKCTPTSTCMHTRLLFTYPHHLCTVCVCGWGLGFVVNGITLHHPHPPFVTRRTESTSTDLLYSMLLWMSLNQCFSWRGLTQD